MWQPWPRKSSSEPTRRPAETLPGTRLLPLVLGHRLLLRHLLGGSPPVRLGLPGLVPVNRKASRIHWTLATVWAALAIPTVLIWKDSILWVFVAFVIVMVLR